MSFAYTIILRHKYEKIHYIVGEKNPMTVRKRKNLPETPDAFLLGSELSQEQEGGSGFAEHDDENGEKKKF